MLKGKVKKNRHVFTAKQIKIAGINKLIYTAIAGYFSIVICPLMKKSDFKHKPAFLRT